MSNVISASRRTDIPAFYADWFIRRLRAGSVTVLQPYSRRPSVVSLLPEDVSAFVFWSKNYAPLLSRLDAVEKTSRNLFFHFTITANHELEGAVPDHRDAVKDFLFLCRRYGTDRVLWRYDPICVTDKLSFEMHDERFAMLAEKLEGQVKKCVISFVHPYKKVVANMAKYGNQTLAPLSDEVKRDFAHRLALRAEVKGIRMYACCNDYLLSDSVGKASCVNGAYLSKTFKTPLDTRPASLREECACTRSIDIGAYDTCGHGCLYCYANTDKNRAGAALLKHDPSWNALGGRVNDAGVLSGAKE
ncbi:MAG TPA: DUF1848 domain-containing protein [Nitrospirota bacterium]|nr:DUF1848 domain-containing protein [Nitrospirota bacterium]